MTDQTNWGTFEGILGTEPVTIPYVSGIPNKFTQGDSATWQDNPLVDANEVSYESSTYNLTYVLAGATAPLSVLAVANGQGWQTTITPTQSAALTPGTYWWKAYLSALDNSTRVTVAEGELTVEADLALASAGYDGRTLAEIAYSNAKAAYSTFSASNGVVKMYRIGTREMTFQNLADIKAQVDYWKAQVVIEQSKARGATDRMISIRFDRAR